MRYRINDYTISGQVITLLKELTIEDVRLVVNETQKKVICSSMQKSNVEISENTIIVPEYVCTLVETDKLTIEIDKGDSLEDINITVPEVDLSSVAKQGTNTEATNTAILAAVQEIPNLKNIYSARFEKNDDNVNTYTMVLPLVAGIEGDTIIL